LKDFNIQFDEKFQKKQRHKAREIRNTQWWKRKCSQGLCYYCNNNFPIKELTMDHIVPVSRGGKSIKSNVVPCCKKCNTKKKHLVPIEWQEYMKNQKNL